MHASIRKIKRNRHLRFLRVFDCSTTPDKSAQKIFRAADQIIRAGRSETSRSRYNQPLSTNRASRGNSTRLAFFLGREATAPSGVVAVNFAAVKPQLKTGHTFGEASLELSTTFALYPVFHPPITLRISSPINTSDGPSPHTLIARNSAATHGHLDHFAVFLACLFLLR